MQLLYLKKYYSLKINFNLSGIFLSFMIQGTYFSLEIALDYLNSIRIFFTKTLLNRIHYLQF